MLTVKIETVRDRPEEQLSRDLVIYIIASLHSVHMAYKQNAKQAIFKL